MKLLYLALLIITAVPPYQSAPKNTIPWDAARKLTWKDFKGKPEKHIDLVAMTYSTILYKYSTAPGSVELELAASFDPQTSWTKDDTSAYLLNHEQKHFDITELFVRKLCKALSEATLTTKNYQTKISQLYKQTAAEWQEYQKQYDEATDNSLIKSAQETWNTKIAEALEELSAYDKTQMTLTLQ